MAEVIFIELTQADYDALGDRPPNTVYWTSDTHRIYKGDSLYGGGGSGTGTVNSVVPGDNISQ